MSDNRDTSALFGMRGRLDAVERNMETLSQRGGGGTSGGMTDDWKEDVNKQLQRLHDDVRRLTGWIITGIAVPLLAIIGLYVYTGSRSDALGQRIGAIEVEQARQGGKLDLLLARTTPSDVPGTAGVSSPSSGAPAHGR